MSKGEIAIHAADTYDEQLESEGWVIASFAQAPRAHRCELVHGGCGARPGGEAVMPDELLDEVTALVEWPVVYESGFEQEFLESCRRSA